MKKYTTFNTPLPPWFDDTSETLVLGSFPSIGSLKISCYYGHPSNRFWKVLSAVFNEEVGVTPDDRKAFALSHRLALTDTLCSCQRVNSADDFLSVEPNEKVIFDILTSAPVNRIITTGKAAQKFFEKYLFEKVLAFRPNIIYIPLPSTSSRSRISPKELIEKYEVLKQ